MENNKTKRGVVLLALRHPYYGNMASQLCAGIKFISPETKIALLHDKKGIGHLTNIRLNLFDEKIVAEKLKGAQ